MTRAEPAHRINVPAARMSLLSDDPEHFLRWIAEHAATAGDGDALRPDGALFPRRSVFGNYVNAMLQPLIASGAIEHRRTPVSHVLRDDARWLIIDGDGTETWADIVVIATSHPPPVAPGQLQAVLKDHPRFVPDPTRSGRACGHPPLGPGACGRKRPDLGRRDCRARPEGP